MIWKELETIKKSATEVVHKKVAILTGSLVTYHDTKTIPFWCGEHEMEKKFGISIEETDPCF